MTEVGLERSFRSLRRFLGDKPQATALEKCELCSETIPPRHRHLIEPAIRKLLCVCDACSIVFSEDGATKYRKIPREVQRLAGLKLPDQSWESLLIPINLAFFYKASALSKVVAVYPSRTGVTESSLELAEWSNLENANPPLLRMRPDVEAFIVNRLHQGREYFIAPIDRSFELVGLVRKHWQGFTGGDRVQSELSAFFTKLREESRP